MLHKRPAAAVAGGENTEETPHGMIRDGVVVMPKGTVLPDGWGMLDNRPFPKED